MPPIQAFNQGDLDQAIDLAKDQVRNNPGSADARMLLSQLLCFTGDVERADTVLAAVPAQDPQVMMTIHVTRQLFVAAQARLDAIKGGALPVPLVEMDDILGETLKAMTLHRTGKPAEALEILDKLEAARPASSARINGQTVVEDLRDASDLPGAFVELLLGNGTYAWLAWSQVGSLIFEDPAQPLDLLYRPAQLKLKTDASAEASSGAGDDADPDVDGDAAPAPEVCWHVWVPALYTGSQDATDPAVRLGHATDWVGEEGASPVTGLGQRLLATGDDAMALMEIKTIQGLTDV